MQKYLLSRTFTEVDPKSKKCKNGDFIDSGYVFQDRPADLYDMIRELSDCTFLSSDPVSSPRDLTGHEWAMNEPFFKDGRSGTSSSVERCESVHIRKANGDHVSPSILFRIFKIAHLTSSSS